MTLISPTNKVESQTTMCPVRSPLGRFVDSTTRILQGLSTVAVIGALLAVSGGALAPLAGTLFGAGGWAAMVGGSTAALLAGGAISIIGTLGIAAHIPPELPRLCDQREALHG